MGLEGTLERPRRSLALKGVGVASLEGRKQASLPSTQSAVFRALDQREGAGDGGWYFKRRA